MKKSLSIIVAAGLICFASCEKEQPAENVAGTYSGVLQGKHDGNDILLGNHSVRVSTTTKNKCLVEIDSIYNSFEVLVTQQGINVDPVSTDEEVSAFLYQGELKELSFTFNKNGDTAIYVGTKP